MGNGRMNNIKHLRKRRAYAQVNRALGEGLLIKPNACELCGLGCEHTTIIGHHWNGYDYPYDLWWVCKRCNALLSGKHDGSLTMRDAKRLVRKHALCGFCEQCDTVKSGQVLVRHRG